MTSYDNPFVQAAGRAIEQGFGQTPVFTREGGSIPVVSTFQEELGLPSVLFGVGLPDENAHAPNEKLDVGNFHGGVIASAILYEEIADGVTIGRTRRRKDRRADVPLRPLRSLRFRFRSLRPSPTRKIRGLRFCASALNVGDAMLLFRTSAVFALNTLNASRIAADASPCSTLNARAARRSVFHRLS